MSSFVYDGLFDSGKTIEDDGACTAFHVVDGRLSKGEGGGSGDGIAVDTLKSVGGHGVEGDERREMIGGPVLGYCRSLNTILLKAGKIDDWRCRAINTA